MTHQSTSDSEYIILARFGRPYGVRGWIHVFSYTTPPEKILEYSAWFIDQDNTWQTVSIENSKFHSNHVVVQIENINEREQVKRYTNLYIAIKREELPILSETEYYWTDLIGLSVVTTLGVNLGRVENLMETGANDVLIVKNEKQERLIPYTKQVIKSIDLADKIMVVDWDPEF